MRIVCIGGGPAGLYLSILLKQADPTHEITVVERNGRGSTFGWGVVLSDETLSNLSFADEKTSKQITDTLAHWDDIDVHFKGRVVRSTGHGFCGISREKLLHILSDRAEELGVKLVFDRDVEDESDFKNADLIVACDGVNSRIRTKYAEFFKPDIDKRVCKFTWLGTKKIFPAFTFIFEKTKWGWFQAHCYRFDKDTSTFIVECPEETWRAAGIDKMEKEQGVKFCEDLFAKYLDGQPLLSKSAHLLGSSAWINFQRIVNQKWHHKNIVLLGDAAATAHFSIGSGSKLAMESAVCLARVLKQEKNLDKALGLYQQEREVEVLKLQSAARNSTEWFETVELKEELPIEQLTYSLLTRSQRVSHENLRVRDKNYLEGFERWFFEKETGRKASKNVPPMFVPYTLRGMELKNRVAVSPMAMYSASDGTPADFHLVHLGARALGGAGLVFTEMTCVSPEARITPGCAGLYKPEHEQAWKRIVDFVHANSEAKIAVQLGHSGPKGSTKLPWEAEDQKLDSGNWELIAPSAIAHGPKYQLPREMTVADMQKVVADFISATKMAEQAGFDMIELHCAHGYLLSSFISPLTNKRSDAYGGSTENRCRFPIEVFSALRSNWPKEKPISVRISASDWVPGGLNVEEAVQVSRLFSEAGADIIDVSTGQVSKLQKPVYGRMYQTPFAERIKAELKISTMAVGNIFEPDHVNMIIGSGRADLCLLARPHLADPQWTLRAAAMLGYEDLNWPKQYLSAKRQMEVNFERAKSVIGKV